MTCHAAGVSSQEQRTPLETFHPYGIARVANHHLPRGLFARAACYRAQNEFALALADLEEALEIAERGEMKLFLADYHLEASRLEIKEQKANSKRQAEEHLAIAKEMIEQMGYGRRKPEVEELERQIKSM